MRPVYLLAPRYVLGEIREEVHPALAERARSLGMPADPGLWGWGQYRRTERDLTDLAVDTGRATLACAGTDPSEVDALLLCATKFPGGPHTHGRFVQTIMAGLGVDAEFLGLTLNRCTNLLAALGVADALVRSGRHRMVLVITADKVTGAEERLENFAVFSDGAASCLVSAEPGAGGYELLGTATARDPGALDWGNEISSDLARSVNDALLTPHGLTVGDLAALMHNNLYTPIVTLKERQAGFTRTQLNTGNTARVGHCFAADPLINLVDHATPGDAHYLLAASVPGARAAVLLRATAA